MSQVDVREYLTNTDEIRDRRRYENIEKRLHAREKLISRKRARLDNFEDKTIEYNKDNITKAALDLEKNKSTRLSTLQFLRKAFSHNVDLSDDFLRIPNSLDCLVGILSGTFPELQMEAVWCLTNMAAGSHHTCLSVAKLASPYLITYLNSSSSTLQDHSAWALGNISSDCLECQELLISQGVLPPLIKLTKSTYPYVVHSALFALANLAHSSENTILSKMVEAGLLEVIFSHMSTEDDNTLTETFLIIFHLVSKFDLPQRNLQDLLKRSLHLFVKHFSSKNSVIITGLIRSIGSTMACIGDDVPDVATSLCDVEVIRGFTFCLFMSDHIQKETLWMLSNMTGSTVVCQGFVTQGVCEQVIAKMKLSIELGKQATIFLCNIASHGCFNKQLLDMDICQPLGMVLLSPSLTDQALLLTDLLFYHADKNDSQVLCEKLRTILATHRR